MAVASDVIELYDSREQHITLVGNDIVTKYNATWDAWNDWSNLDLPIPVIGEAWSNDWPNVKCTDLRAKAVKNSNTRCEVTALWTDYGFSSPQREENQATSWNETLTIQSVVEQLDWYYDDLVDTWKSWKDTWIATGGDSDILPELTQRTPTADYTITAYGDKSYITRVLQNKGKVNEEKFLLEYSAKKAEADEAYQDDVTTIDDTGQWFFEGAHITRIASNRLRYDFHFLYHNLGWNTPYLINVGGVPTPVATYQYKTFDFWQLFDGMDRLEEQADYEGRS